MLRSMVPAVGPGLGRGFDTCSTHPLGHQKQSRREVGKAPRVRYGGGGDACWAHGRNRTQRHSSHCMDSVWWTKAEAEERGVPAARGREGKKGSRVITSRAQPHSPRQCRGAVVNNHEFVAEPVDKMPWVVLLPPARRQLPARSRRRQRQQAPPPSVAHKNKNLVRSSCSFS